jgi:hypothetical protein
MLSLLLLLLLLLPKFFILKVNHRPLIVNEFEYLNCSVSLLYVTGRRVSEFWGIVFPSSSGSSSHTGMSLLLFLNCSQDESHMIHWHDAKVYAEWRSVTIQTTVTFNNTAVNTSNPSVIECVQRFPDIFEAKSRRCVNKQRHITFLFVWTNNKPTIWNYTVHCLRYRCLYIYTCICKYIYK